MTDVTPSASGSADPRTPPPGNRLVHIGPHQTGTAAVQGALHAARYRLDAHGVVLPSPNRHPAEEAIAATGHATMPGEPEPDPGRWRRLAKAVTDCDARCAVLSSEFFADADDDAAARIVAELGGPAVHVVVTLRPLARILPSQWEQYLRNGLRVGYEEWLEYMLVKEPYEEPTPSFWHRHRHDRLVERWVRAAGAENVTVIVVDDADHGMPLRAFESLTGLPEGFLTAEEDASDRSLTFGEAEMIRRFNVAFTERDWPSDVYSRYLRHGVVAHLKAARRPVPGETPIRTPEWARSYPAEIGAAAAERVAATGVRVIGDLSLLGAKPPEAAEAMLPLPVLDPAVAAEALIGMMSALDELEHDEERAAERRLVEQTGTAELMTLAARRVVRRLRQRRG